MWYLVPPISSCDFFFFGGGGGVGGGGIKTPFPSSLSAHVNGMTVLYPNPCFNSKVF